jgi:SAM-dependent methyltransferase
LEKRGIKAATEVQYPTAAGIMKPDALLQNGANYIVETKLGPQAKLFDAITQLYDYSKYIDVAGGFAILLPEEMRRPVPIEWLEHAAVDPKKKYVATAIFEDKRPSQRFTGSLNELADWISEHVLKPPAYIEPDTSLAISVLTDAVDYITASTLEMDEKELKDIFGGKTVFDNILQYEDGKYPLNEMRKAATYLLINQIMFYHFLSCNDPITFPRIEEDYLKDPSSLSVYFKRVLQIDYKPTFGFDVASRLPSSAIDILKKVVKAIKGIAPEKIKFDLLGKIFHDLIPFEIRKAVAAFYTNNEAAELLAHLSIDDSDAKVMDLACGSGTLLVAAYHRKRALLEETGKYFGSNEHKKFLEVDLTGIDIMPFAAHLAIVHLSLQAPIYETEAVRVAVWDSTELKPEQVIPSIQRELKEAYKQPTLEIFMKGKPVYKEEDYINKGVLTAEGAGGEAISLERTDVVIMNPPFTRQERLPKNYKKALSKRLSEYKNQLHGQLGLWGYFLLLADRFVKPGGRIALVYPARPLNASSAERIRRFLLDRYNIEYLITTWQRSAFSESTLYREILLVIKKLSSKTRDMKSICKVVNLKLLPRDLEDVRSLAQEMKDITSDYESERIRALVLTQEDLANSINNWFIHIAPFDLGIARRWSKIISHSEGHFVSFEEYLKRKDTDFVRGVETKSSFGFPFYETFIVKDLSRALKSYDRWVLEKMLKGRILAKNRYTEETIEIPSDALYLGIRRASGLGNIDLSTMHDHFIIEVFDGIEKILSADSLIKFKDNVKKWKKYVEDKFGRFLISRRFNIASKGTKLLAFYSDYPITGQNLWSLKEVEEDDAKILALWFNSTPNLLQVHLQRIETGGSWMEINKEMISDFALLDPDTLDKKHKQVLLNLFDEIKNINFPSLSKQLEHRNSIRKKIDKAILNILEFNEEEIEELLDYLYPALHRELYHLKELLRTKK